jgi:hypothetical protein
MRKRQFTVIIALLVIFSSFGMIILSEATVHLPPKLVLSPVDLVYEVGSTGNNLVWQFEAHESADFPTTYNITVDGNLTVTKKAWQDRVNINYNVDGLDIGVHLIKIIVSDNGVDTGEANPAKDEAIVTVVEELTTSVPLSEEETTISMIGDTTTSDPMSEDESSNTGVEETTTSEPINEQTTSTSERSEITNFPLSLPIIALFLSSALIKKRKTR